jgi:hypothetical protein
MRGRVTVTKSSEAEDVLTIAWSWKSHLRLAAFREVSIN